MLLDLGTKFVFVIGFLKKKNSYSRTTFEPITIPIIVPILILFERFSLEFSSSVVVVVIIRSVEKYKSDEVLEYDDDDASDEITDWLVDIICGESLPVSLVKD